jgi:hypothetical protein
VTKGRTIVVYNREFDRMTVTRHARRDRLDPADLADACRWSCLMNRRSDWLMRRRWIPLDGSHRARADCEVAFGAR